MVSQVFHCASTTPSPPSPPLFDPCSRMFTLWCPLTYTHTQTLTHKLTCRPPEKYCATAPRIHNIFLSLVADVHVNSLLSCCKLLFILWPKFLILCLTCLFCGWVPCGMKCRHVWLGCRASFQLFWPERKMYPVVGSGIYYMTHINCITL